jgi:hypothetical protein
VYDRLSPPDLANTVTGFATLFAGVVTVLLCRYVRAQPPRWRFAYWCIVITGIPTILFHGYLTMTLAAADVSSNLLLAWALQLAVLGDFWPARVRNRVAATTGAINLAGVAWIFREAITGEKHYLIPFGGHGGFYTGEVVLILDSFLVVGLLFARRREIAARAKPLLYLVTATFTVGLFLATAGNQEVAEPFWSYHALWHVVGAFGFVLFWAFNHVRFEEATAGAPPEANGSAGARAS